MVRKMAPSIQFTFVCPLRGQPFHSDAFAIVNNRGGRRLTDGTLFLDATLELTVPCPYCGARHRFAAQEVACPFDAERGIDESSSGW